MVSNPNPKILAGLSGVSKLNRKDESMQVQGMRLTDVHWYPKGEMGPEGLAYAKRSFRVDFLFED